MQHLEVVGESHDFPITPKEHGVDYLLDRRHLWIRSERQTAILRIRHEVINAVRDFFNARGFILTDTPIFTPAVGRYAQGMIVEVPLHLDALPGKPGVGGVHAALAKAYHGAHFVEVVPLATSAALKTLQPEELNDTNRMKLFVFGAETGRQARLVALLDNLGKGAAGQAVQNMNIMLGFPEATGLS